MDISKVPPFKRYLGHVTAAGVFIFLTEAPIVLFVFGVAPPAKSRAFAVRELGHVVPRPFTST